MCNARWNRSNEPRPTLAAAEPKTGAGGPRAASGLSLADPDAIRLRVQIDILSSGALFKRVAAPGAPFDLAWDGWIPDALTRRRCWVRSWRTARADRRPQTHDTRSATSGLPAPRKRWRSSRGMADQPAA